MFRCDGTFDNPVDSSEDAQRRQLDSLILLVLVVVQIALRQYNKTVGK